MPGEGKDIELELIEALSGMKELLRFSLLSTTPEIARDCMVFVKKAEALIERARDARAALQKDPTHAR